MAVYILHFDSPYHHARHYVGYTKNTDKRLAQHKAGSGARLMEVITQAGIGFQLAKVWKSKTRKFERYIKNSHNTARFCPICQKNKANKCKGDQDVWKVGLQR
jgi:predicted GIY-YIG superfamily endonuclease